MRDKFAKPFKTIDEQLAILLQRGLHIPDSRHAALVLQRYGYYRLINGYHKPFEQNVDKYLANQTIDNILALYKFDEALKCFAFKYCLKIEVMLKTTIANAFAEKYSSLGCWNGQNFDTEKDEFYKMFDAINGIKFETKNTLNRLCGKEYDYSKNSNIKNEALLHYMDVHKDIPIWVLMNALTFGVVGKFYNCMKAGSKEAVLKELRIMTGNKFSDKDLKTAFNVITITRNLSAHADILYNTDFKCNVSNTYPHMGEIINTYNQNSKTKMKSRSSAIALIVICAFFNSDEINNDLNSLGACFDEMMNLQTTHVKNKIKEQMGYDFVLLIKLLTSKQ